jgi:amidase
MTPRDLCQAGATELHDSFLRRALSPVEVVDATLRRIQEVDDRLGAFVSLYEDEARQRAQECERIYMTTDQPPPLCGIPIAIKDCESIAERITTFGVPALARYVAGSTSVQAERVISAGAVAIGKTNMPPLGYAGVTDNRLFGPTSTPYGLGYNAGGSSGGSAAAVGAELVPLAVGSDGGGSLRMPAALCGVVGFKATFGVIPSGAVGDSFSTHNPFMVTGPMGRSVADVRMLAQVMQGIHALDPFSVPAGAVNWRGQEAGVKGLRVAYSPRLGAAAAQSDVADVVRDAALLLASAGAHVDETEIPTGASTDALCNCWRLHDGTGQLHGMQRLLAEGFDVLASPNDLPMELVADVAAAHSATSDEYRVAADTRSLALAALERAFTAFDLIMTPTVSIDGIPNGHRGGTRGPTDIDGVPIDSFFLGWAHTAVLNLTGHPAASVPVGFSARGLPVGMQVIGRRFDDGSVLQACEVIEELVRDRGKEPVSTRADSVWNLACQ